MPKTCNHSSPDNKPASRITRQESGSQPQSPRRVMNPGHTSSLLILGSSSGATGSISETSLKYQQRTHTQSQHRQQPLHQIVIRDVNEVNKETPRTVHLQQHQEQ